jgi:multimeric flavodoxin WrbA
VKATFLSCTLKSSPEESNTEALAQVLIDELERNDVECTMHRLADLKIKFGTTSDEGDGDEWPAVRADIVDSEILVIGSPTWFGHPSAIAQLALERMNALLSETDDQERPLAYGKVAGVVVTGNEDGAHHVISEICGALNDIGFTTPGQAWTYWNRGPGPGDTYLETDAGKDWSHSTGVTAARNLLAAARAFDPNPFSAPPS